jgi:tRNA(Ile)-lysidine synthetase-like protein
LLAHLLAEAIREYGAFASYSLIGEVLRKYSTSPRGALVLYESPSLLIEKTLLNGKEHILIGAPRARPETAEWEYGVPGTAGTINLKEAGMRLSVGCCDYDFFSRNRRKEHLLFVAVSADSRLVLRNRRPGDRIRLESGTKKIKDFFIDKKIGAEIKQMIPLLLVNSNVAAVMAGFLTAGGNRVAESALVNEKSDKILFFERSGHVF